MIDWQEPPAIVRTTEATALGKLALAVGACSNYGYQTSAEAAKAEVERFVVAAQANGISEAAATDLFVAAAEAAQSDWVAMITPISGENAQDEQTRMMTLGRELVSSCAEASRQYPAAVITDGDEPQTLDELIAFIQSPQRD